jgi:hypothetical protein
MTSESLTQDILHEIVRYVPETGAFFWRERPRHYFQTGHHHKMWNVQNAGKIAGSINSRGYWRITIRSETYTAHRLAWLYVFGTWPAMALDHINQNKVDNRISNLREATSQQNSQNLPRTERNKSGMVGVCWNRAQREWFAYISVSKKQQFIGNFKSKDAAIAARKAAEMLYGYHPNHGL